jgi:hypothetical protein
MEDRCFQPASAVKLFAKSEATSVRRFAEEVPVLTAFEPRR